MIEGLEDLIRNFPRPANQTRCFNHIVALVAMWIVQQFDVPKGNDADAMDDAEKELMELAQGSDVEETIAQKDWESVEDEEDKDKIAEWGEDDNEEGGLDWDTLNESLRPGRILLVKVCKVFWHEKRHCAYLGFVAAQDLVLRHPFQHDLAADVV